MHIRVHYLLYINTRIMAYEFACRFWGFGASAQENCICWLALFKLDALHNIKNAQVYMVGASDVYVYNVPHMLGLATSHTSISNLQTPLHHPPSFSHAPLFHMHILYLNERIHLFIRQWEFSNFPT